MGQLVGYGHDQNVTVCLGLQLTHPFADRVVGAVEAQDDGSSAMDEQSSEICVATLTDPSSHALPSVECCFGSSPSHAAKSRPLVKADPLPTAATRAVAISGPTPGTSSSRWHAASWLAMLSITPQCDLFPGEVFLSPDCSPHFSGKAKNQGMSLRRECSIFNRAFGSYA
ncbi:MAG: hypothetical protein JWQ49_5795 [Edaphobacter sp.]|nr:hypothetical protein [Edaphobacter sp.]